MDKSNIPTAVVSFKQFLLAYSIMSSLYNAVSCNLKSHINASNPVNLLSFSYSFLSVFSPCRFTVQPRINRWPLSKLAAGPPYAPVLVSLIFFSRSEHAGLWICKLLNYMQLQLTNRHQRGNRISLILYNFKAMLLFHRI